MSSKYDHRISLCIQRKDKAVRMQLLTKPTAPMKTDPNDTSKKVLDKDGEEWVIYQIRLKKYIDCITKLEDDLQQKYDMIIGHCSPAMEQLLTTINNFDKIKEQADSINLLKSIEQICYNYQPHEYPPLEAWEALDKLGKAIQPQDVIESDHYESIKTIVEVCKASGINFPLLCTHTVDMVMATLSADGTIVHQGKYKDGGYFKLTEDHRDLVNEKAEEIFIATRLLSLSLNKKFGASKQELRNDLVKGKR